MSAGTLREAIQQHERRRFCVFGASRPQGALPLAGRHGETVGTLETVLLCRSMNSPKTSPPTHDLRPLPESREAKALGCTCSILRDRTGRTLRDRDGKPLYAMSEGCPVHR